MMTVPHLDVSTPSEGGEWTCATFAILLPAPAMAVLARLRMSFASGSRSSASDVFYSLALWSERIMVALPNSHSLADKPVIHWPELKSERFLISHNDPGPES